MAHSVKITTPMPTWEETADFYGLSKADRKFISGLVDGKKSGASATNPSKLSSGLSKRMKNGTKAASGVTGKTVSRARKTA
jgi:hypothetical protein